MSDFAPHDRVRHERYGTGTVVAASETRRTTFGPRQSRASVRWDDERKDRTSVLASNLEPTTVREGDA